MSLLTTLIEGRPLRDARRLAAGDLLEGLGPNESRPKAAKRAIGLLHEALDDL